MAVTCRFIPTIFIEYQLIKEAMKLRGIKTGFIPLIKHPIKQIEYILIPLLIRASDLSDELAASAMTRGIDSPNRTSYSLTKFHRTDYLFLFWCIFITTFCIFIQNRGITDAFIF